MAIDSSHALFDIMPLRDPSERAASASPSAAHDGPRLTRSQDIRKAILPLDPKATPSGAQGCLSGSAATPRKASYFDKYPERKNGAPYVPSPTLTPKVKLIDRAKVSRAKTSDGASKQPATQEVSEGQTSGASTRQAKEAISSSAENASNEYPSRRWALAKRGLSVDLHLPLEVLSVSAHTASSHNLPDKPLSPSVAAAARAGLIQRQGVLMSKTQSVPQHLDQTQMSALRASKASQHIYSGHSDARQWHSRRDDVKPRQSFVLRYATASPTTADETLALQDDINSDRETLASSSDSVGTFGTMRRVLSHSTLQDVRREPQVLAKRPSTAALTTSPPQPEKVETAVDLISHRNAMLPVDKICVPSIKEIIGRHQPAMGKINASVLDAYRRQSRIASVQEESSTFLTDLETSTPTLDLSGSDGKSSEPVIGGDTIGSLATFSFQEHANLAKTLSDRRGSFDSVVAPSETVEYLAVDDRRGTKQPRTLKSKKSISFFASRSSPDSGERAESRQHSGKGGNVISRGLRRMPSLSPTPRAAPRSSSLQEQPQNTPLRGRGRSFTTIGLGAAESEREISQISDHTDNDAQDLFTSARLNHIYKLQGGPYRGLQVSFADVGDPLGHPVFVYLGLGAIRFIVGLYDDIAKWNGLRLICIDRWGLGKTDDMAAERRLVLGWSEVVRQVADHLNIARFSVLAHSAGTPYAMGSCIALPSRIVGPIYLLAPWVGGDVETGYKWLRYVPDTVIRTAQAAEWHLQSWRLGFGKPSSPADEDTVVSDALKSLQPSSTAYEKTRDKRSPHNANNTQMRSTQSDAGSHWSKRQVRGDGMLRTISNDGMSLSSSESCRTIGSGGLSDSCTSLNTSFASSYSPKKPTEVSASRQAKPSQTSLASTLGIQPSLQPPPLPAKGQQPQLNGNIKSPARQQSASAPAEDFGTELLRASHAECSSSASTADLLVILGRASQRPWGFSYEDVKHPVRVWHGEKDDRIGIGSALWMERTLADCRVTVVKGAGHNLLTDSNVVVEVLESIARDRRSR